MELIRANAITVLANPGYTSSQLLFSENSCSERITVTRVTMQPGSTNSLHRHPVSEQVWIALRGSGHLLLESGQRIAFAAGDVARFVDNELHGFENSTAGEFEYISVTSPPVNFRTAYEAELTVVSATATLKR